MSERLIRRFGAPSEQYEEEGITAGFWLVDARILLLHAEGRATAAAADWAAAISSAHCRDAVASHGRRMYLAWSFRDLSYSPKIGAQFVGWLHEHRQKLLRTALYTENRILRMTGMATNLSFNNTASFPEDEDAFHATLDDWLARIHRRRE